MASGDSSGKDEFADAKANIRDTVKWLATTYAALAAFVVGGASINGLGDLPIDSPKFAFAVAALLVGFLGICFALILALRILRPVQVYRSELLYPTPIRRWYDLNAAEANAVRNEIDRHARDLLPHNYRTGLNAIATAITQTEQLLQTIPNPPVTAQQTADRNKGVGLRDKLYATTSGLLPLAVYLRLQIRLQRALPWLVGWGILALAGLAAFGVLTHEKKADDKPPGAVMNIVEHPSDATALPELRAVLFATGRAEITDDGLAAIAHARAALRRHPESLLLMRAHTDTVAPMPVNSELARKRARAVLNVLSGSGGIAPARLFFAELPKSDLPQVTLQDKGDRSNRSVEMALVRP